MFMEESRETHPAHSGGREGKIARHGALSNNTSLFSGWRRLSPSSAALSCIHFRWELAWAEDDKP